MKTPFTYYWSRHKTFLIAMTVVIIACAVTGLYTWQAFVPIPVFILVLLSRTSRFNPEWEVAKREFNDVHKYEDTVEHDIYKCASCDRYKPDVMAGYCNDCWFSERDDSMGGDQMLSNLS